MTLEAAYGREMNIGNSPGGHSCSQHANFPLKKLEMSVPLCWATKLHILEWPFIVSSTRCTCVTIMLLSQLLATTVRWVDDLGKGEMLTNRDVNTFVPPFP
jgi:hypothetical protein